MRVIFRKMWFSPGHRTKLDKLRTTGGRRYKARPEAYDLPESLRQYLPTDAVIVPDEAPEPEYDHDDTGMEQPGDPSKDVEDSLQDADLARANSDALTQANDQAAEENERNLNAQKFKRQLAEEQKAEAKEKARVGAKAKAEAKSKSAAKK